VICDQDNVKEMEPEEGKALVSLATCELLDYEKCLIVEGESVEGSTWIGRAKI